MKSGFWLIAAGLVCLFAVSDLTAQPRYPNGLYISTPQGAVQLTTYAERTSRGTLRLQTGSLQKVPVIEPNEALRVLVNIPLWVPAFLMVASEEIFIDDEAEQRRMLFASRRINIYASELRVADLEQPAKMMSLFRDVRASAEYPGYVFIALGSNGMVRYYPIRLSFEGAPKDDALDVHGQDAFFPASPQAQ